MDALPTIDAATLMAARSPGPDAGRAASAEGLSRARAEEVGRKFEAQFLSQMFKHMSDGVETEKSLFGGGNGERMFRSFMMDEYGKLVAERGGVGIADAVTAQILARQ